MAGSQTILLCDDEAHIRHVLSVKLGNAGYEVLPASNGEEGLAIATDYDIDLVITDYQMPKLNGLQLAEALRRQEQKRMIPVILITARCYGLDEEQVRQSNIKQVMSKPFSPREVLRVAQDQLAKASGGIHA